MSGLHHLVSLLVTFLSTLQCLKADHTRSGGIVDRISSLARGMVTKGVTNQKGVLAIYQGRSRRQLLLSLSLRLRASKGLAKEG